MMVFEVNNNSNSYVIPLTLILLEKHLNQWRKSRDAGKGGGHRGASPPLPFLKGGRWGGAKVPFYKVYFINVYMWTEPYLSIVNHLLSTIYSEIITTAYRLLISTL